MQSLLNEAWKTLLRKDLEEISKNSLATKSGNRFILKFINKNYLIDCERQKILFNNEEERNIILSILILHYLCNAKDIPFEDRLISFRELFGGDIYYNVFYENAIFPLTALTQEQFFKALKELNAEELYLGDSSFKIYAFPRIPITVIYWRGNKEIPTKTNILFDATANSHLHTEDLSKIGMIVSKEILKYLKGK